MNLPVKELWAHHTVTRTTSDPAADTRTVQQVAFGRGFNDISYSYLIHPNGTILEGRGLRIGAHTKGRNSIALAIAFIGDYSRTDPTNEQMAAASWLAAHLVGIGALVPNFELRGHRQNPLSPSACPGDKLFPRLHEWLRPPTSPEEDDMSQYDDQLNRLEMRVTALQNELVAETGYLRKQLNSIGTTAGFAEQYVRETVRIARALAEKLDVTPKPPST